MTFELYYSGSWHALDNVLAEPFDMTRGRSSEDETTPPQSVRLSLLDSDQRYNPLNPRSDLWGLVGPNTPLRISVGGTARWCGEVASWVPRRTMDYDLSTVLAGGQSDGGKAWIDIEAYGVTRRLGQGKPPVLSAIRRSLAATSPVAYWPMEDGTDATLAASAVQGQAPLTIKTGVIDFETDGAPVGSAGYAKLVESFADVISGPVLGMADTGEWQVAFWVKGRDAEAGYDEFEVLNVFTSADNTAIWQITITDSGDLGLGPSARAVVNVLDSTGATVDTLLSGETTGMLDGNWYLVQLTVDRSGSNVDYALYIDGTLSASATLASKAMGPVRGVQLPAEPSQTESTEQGIAHLAVWDTATVVPLASAGRGYDGESAGARIQGVAGEEGVTMAWTGTLTNSVIMGAQTPDTTVGIFADAAATDMGILSEMADQVGIHYRPRSDLLNQTPALTLEFEEKAFATADPVLDDKGRANDVEVSRPSGSSARASLETGSSTAVDRIGRMTDQAEANVQTDAQLADQAGWRLHVASWPGARYPQVTIDLDARPDLVADVEALTFGDILRITGLEFDPVDLMIQGWSEHIETHRRTIAFNCTPAGPWTVATLDDAEYGYLGSDGSTTAASFNAGHATSLSVAVATGYPLWVTGSVDFDITAAGVRLHVTSIAGASSPQTFTVDIVPVNGLYKTIPSGSTVELVPAAYVGM